MEGYQSRRIAFRVLADFAAKVTIFHCFCLLSRNEQRQYDIVESKGTENGKKKAAQHEEGNRGYDSKLKKTTNKTAADTRPENRKPESLALGTI